ncbi:MAG: hypothetical protein ACD_17C00298G0001, partial [uncultured bacterium]
MDRILDLFRNSRFLRFLTIFLAAGCSHTTDTWENMKTAGRYMQKGVDDLLGKDFESRMLSSDDEFYGPNDDDFIPLSD